MTANIFQNLPEHTNFKDNPISDTAQKKQTSTVQYNHKCFLDYAIQTSRCPT